jgi:hypothetical protein
VAPSPPTDDQTARKAALAYKQERKRQEAKRQKKADAEAK